MKHQKENGRENRVVVLSPWVELVGTARVLGQSPKGELSQP